MVLFYYSYLYISYFNTSHFCGRHIYQDDLMQFMRDDEALMIISHFKGASGRKGISMKQLNNWMIIYRFVWTAKTIIILVYVVMPADTISSFFKLLHQFILSWAFIVLFRELSLQVYTFKERRVLVSSLIDTKETVNKFYKIFNILVSLIIFIIWCLIIKVSGIQFFVLLSSQFLLCLEAHARGCSKGSSYYL